MSSRKSTARTGLALVAGLALILGRATAAPEKLLPDKSEVVVSINVKGLVDSELAKKYDASGKVRDAIKAQPQAQAILEQLHLDPLKDVHSVTVAMAGIKMGRNNNPEMPDELLVIIRGNFEQDRIIGALTAFAAA
ncbi:MAG: hypothetical protein C5B58_11700, partial [Acidobacteria bacterium]